MDMATGSAVDNVHLRVGSDGAGAVSAPADSETAGRAHRRDGLGAGSAVGANDLDHRDTQVGRAAGRTLRSGRGRSSRRLRGRP